MPNFSKIQFLFIIQQNYTKYFLILPKRKFFDILKNIFDVKKVKLALKIEEISKAVSLQVATTSGKDFTSICSVGVKLLSF